MRTPMVLVLCAAVVLPACLSRRRAGTEAIESETRFDDDALVCRRVHAVTASRDEGLLAFELPAVAELVVRTSDTYGRNACGDQLLAWLRGQLDARPIDLRPRLEARVRALGPFIASHERWRGVALGIIDRLLLDGSEPVLHLRERFTYPGPGPWKFSTGWRPIVSSDALDGWAVSALVRGTPQDGFWADRRGPTSGDEYVDLIVRLFSRRYAEPPPPRAATLYLMALPVYKRAIHSPPPAPSKLGCRSTPFDVLWPDLVRAYRTWPDYPRWASLSPGVREQLRAAPTECLDRRGGEESPHEP
jgi:hypothetical protein